MPLFDQQPLATIDPIQVFDQQAVAFTISSVSVSFNTSASWQVNFLTANNQVVFTKSVYIVGDEYSAWGADDYYLVQKTVEKLGLKNVSKIVSTTQPLQ